MKVFEFPKVEFCLKLFEALSPKVFPLSQGQMSGHNVCSNTFLHHSRTSSQFASWGGTLKCPKDISQ